MQRVFHDGLDLGLQIFHTPGHTPDELALWDQTERVLFVGDTIYEWAPIIFPKEGSVIDYSSTIGKLKALVHDWNSNSNLPKVKMACGHNTDSADGEDLLREVDTTLYHCINQWIEPSETTTFRGEPILSFERADGRLSFSGPQRLFDNFRLDPPAMEAITNRQSLGVQDATADVKLDAEGDEMYTSGVKVGADAVS